MIRLANTLIRPLHDSELALANHWAVDEGWNPGLHDAAVFNQADPGSLLTLEVEGAPVGVMSATRFTDEQGFLGFFVMAPEFRRGRYAWTLMKAGLDRIGDRVLGAESVLELVRTYARYGLTPHYQTVSYQGVSPVRPMPWKPGVEIASAVAPDLIAAYDHTSVGVARTPFIKAWLTLPDSQSLVFRREGRLCGFGVARRCPAGVRIGPLQADHPDVAEALFDALSGWAPGELVSIDCPGINPSSALLAAARGLRPGSTSSRLYRGTPPTGASHRVYGLMSFAFG
jgi:hypothetical protein